MGLNIINNVHTSHSKTTQNTTTNTLDTFSQMNNDRELKSKTETSVFSESEYVTDSDFEPATEDDVEITILDCDLEQSKISKEKPPSLMRKVKSNIFFTKDLFFFKCSCSNTIFQIDLVLNILKELCFCSFFCIF